MQIAEVSKKYKTDVDPPYYYPRGGSTSKFTFMYLANDAILVQRIHSAFAFISPKKCKTAKQK